MMRRTLGAGALVLLLALTGEAKQPPPNLVLFLVDDLGWQDTSVPFHSERTPFNQRYRTPHLERLAERGLRFTQSYASAPVCTPTRTAIMTGRSPGQTHITWWTLQKDTDTSTRHATLKPPAWRVNGLAETDVTLPALLQQHGYRTIHVGKAHFAAHDTFGADPADLGFDVNIAGHASGGPASYLGRDHFTVAGRNGEPPHSKPTLWDIPGLEKYHGHDLYLTEALALEASVALRAAVRDERPFFLNFAPYAVHAPIMANQLYLSHYPDLDPKEAAYATMVETYDAALGALVETLRELKQLDNTLILFSSDNGGLSAHGRGGEPHIHNAPLRSGKGSAYEGGTRVPTIVAGPGVTRSGGVDSTPIISHDFFPTLLGLAGIRIPEELKPSIEGRDLRPLFREPTAAFDMERPLFWHQPHQWGAPGPGIAPFSSVRQADWKLIYFHADRHLELYDLAHDLGETTNLAAQHPERVATLARTLEAWIKTRGAQMSIEKSTGQPVALPHAALVADSR